MSEFRSKALAAAGLAESVDAAAPAATVFYDGACPLCRREIAHYRRLRGAERVLWIDIARADAPLATYGLSRELAMARLHVRDTAGHWQTGAFGFAELWSHLPGYRWLARTLRLLRLLPLLDRVYASFARWRLRRACDERTCGRGR
jgi:predicted DCC family thiol-disulfide oxidoreductase YuxK